MDVPLSTPASRSSSDLHADDTVILQADDPVIQQADVGSYVEAETAEKTLAWHVYLPGSFSTPMGCCRAICMLLEQDSGCGKLQADHNHLAVLLSDSIHNLKSELHSTLDQHIGNTLKMQSM